MSGQGETSSHGALGPVSEITTADYHTGGEPFRIVTGGADAPVGNTVLDRRDDASRRLDDVRAFLCNEPRGHADMYGCFVTPPDDPAGDLGVVFFHKDGFSTACGHGTIALATWAVESGRIPRRGAHTDMVIDAPSGRLRCVVETPADRSVGWVRFTNVASSVHALDVEVTTAFGTLTVDISFGGAFYASVRAADAGLAVTPADLDRLIALGRAVKAALRGHPSLSHGLDDRLSGLYGVIIFESGSGEVPSGAALHQRNVTIFADGEVDRSPCGSGTSARLAVLDHRGSLATGDTLCNESIVGSRFEARVVDRVVALPEIGAIDARAVITTVQGRAHRIGTSAFTLDPADRLGLGFQLR